MKSPDEARARLYQRIVAEREPSRASCRKVSSFLRISKAQAAQISLAAQLN
jgi:hypothetical protein